MKDVFLQTLKEEFFLEVEVVNIDILDDINNTELQQTIKKELGNDNQRDKEIKKLKKQLKEIKLFIPKEGYEEVKKQIDKLNEKYNGVVKIDKNLSSGKISKTDKPPPLTKYLSTPGGKVLRPGFRISKLVWLFSIYPYISSLYHYSIISQWTLTRKK